MAKIKISNQLANVDGREGETVLVIECLIIYMCGESRRKHGASIRKKELFPIEEMCSLYKTWPHQGFHLMCCNYFVDRFCKRKTRAKEAHCACKGRAREIHWFLFGQKRFQWMASFVENGCPVQATRTKADFCNPREKQKKGLLI